MIELRGIGKASPRPTGETVRALAALLRVQTLSVAIGVSAEEHHSCKVERRPKNTMKAGIYD